MKPSRSPLGRRDILAHVDLQVSDRRVSGEAAEIVQDGTAPGTGFRVVALNGCEQLRGPIAIVVTDPTLYTMACTNRALGLSKMTIEVFRDFDEADAWLNESRPDQRPPDPRGRQGRFG